MSDEPKRIIVDTDWKEEAKREKERIAQEVLDAVRAGGEMCLVIGGGNIFRGMQGAAKGMERASADYMGMLATVMNALAMQNAIEGLGGQARVINGSQYDTDIVANKFLVPNKVQGLFNDIVDTPRLSGTRRYMFTDPAQIPTIEVAFLEGVQEPFLEMQEGWRIDGIEWKERLDYGVAAVDFRGAVTNAGV